MPISGSGFEIHIVRHSLQRARMGAVTRTRTVGTYQVFLDGQPLPGLGGATAEPRGPGDNTRPMNRRRIEAGRYPLLPWAGENYVTLGYADTPVARTRRRVRPAPAVLLGSTGARTEILIHPGSGFLSSIGCINLCAPLPDAGARIAYPDSRLRVIGLIDGLKAFLGDRFPGAGGDWIDYAFAVIDGEP